MSCESFIYCCECGEEFSFEQVERERDELGRCTGNWVCHGCIEWENNPRMK